MDPTTHSLSNMADQDLETDGSALGPGVTRPELSKMFLSQETRHDSGISSFDYTSKSLRSMEDNLCEPTIDDISDDLHVDLNKMCITEVGEETIAPVKATFVSADQDEGFYSKSITDVSYKSYEDFSSQPVQERFRLNVSVGPSQEAIEAYMQDDDGDTQLHMAIIQLDENISLQLINLAHNYDWLNICNNMLQTPLHLAVITKQAKIVRRLMSAGASVDVRDLNGNTPLHIATREGHQDIVAHLLKPVYYEETSENKYEIPYQRIPQDLEAKNYDGLTCLHLAAQGTHVAVMEALTFKGAKVNAQDGKSGRTVLHYAAESGNRILLEFLLGCRRINLDSATYGGLTPVVLAAGRKYGDVVGILQAHGADCTSLREDSDEDDEDMIDDFCLAGEPLSVR